MHVPEHAHVVDRDGCLHVIAAWSATGRVQALKALHVVRRDRVCNLRALCARHVVVAAAAHRLALVLLLRWWIAYVGRLESSLNQLVKLSFKCKIFSLLVL